MILQALVITLCVSAIICLPRQSQDVTASAKCLKKHKDVKGHLLNTNHSLKQLCITGCTAIEIGLESLFDKAYDFSKEKLTKEQKLAIKKCIGSITSTDDCDVGKRVLSCEPKK